MPSVRDLVIQGIYERSPLGRYEKKDFSPGVKSFRTEARCIRDDLTNVFLLQQPPQEVRIPESFEIFKDKQESDRTRDVTITISDFETQLINHLRRQMDIFVTGKDPVVEKREICLSSLVFESPNAVSIGYGFMAFDPQLFFQIIRSEKSNSWSLLGVVAHELSHQFQIWHQDPTTRKTKNNKPFIRDKELQADCAAAAIMAKRKEQEPDLHKEAGIEFETAVFDAFISLGDFELDSLGSHHGTAYERGLMVRTGLDIYEDSKKSQKPLHSGDLLKACGEKINALNKKFGEDLWPIGSKL